MISQGEIFEYSVLPTFPSVVMWSALVQQRRIDDLRVG